MMYTGHSTWCCTTPRCTSPGIVYVESGFDGPSTPPRPSTTPEMHEYARLLLPVIARQQPELDPEPLALRVWSIAEAMALGPVELGRRWAERLEREAKGYGDGRPRVDENCCTSPPPSPEPVAEARPTLAPGWRYAQATENSRGTGGRFACKEGHPSYWVVPDWHNPANVESPGEGYRFCVKGETRADATHFRFEESEVWGEMPDKLPGPLSLANTYRTDLPLPGPLYLATTYRTDRPLPEPRFV